MEVLEKETVEDSIRIFLYHRGDEPVGYGKYRDMKIKDVPESYFIFVYENHGQNSRNKHVYEYGRLLYLKKNIIV